MAREFSKDFYNSKQWKQIRSAVLKRDKYICQFCGSPAEEVHHVIHLTPDNIGNLEVTSKMENLISLCRDCHIEHHKTERVAGASKHHKKSDTPENGVFVNGILTRVPTPPGK